MLIVGSESIANTFGLLALGCTFVGFAPSIIHLIKKNLPQTRFILQIARIGLLVAIALGLAHGLIMTQKSAIDFYNLKTYWIYAEGLFTLNLLVFLTLSFKELKLDNKKLNYFIYGGLFLVIYHVWQYLSF